MSESSCIVVHCFYSSIKHVVPSQIKRRLLKLFYRLIARCSILDFVTVWRIADLFPFSVYSSEFNLVLIYWQKPYVIFTGRIISYLIGLVNPIYGDRVIVGSKFKSWDANARVSPSFNIIINVFCIICLLGHIGNNYLLLHLLHWLNIAIYSHENDNLGTNNHYK